jgi:hypothetical protein
MLVGESYIIETICEVLFNNSTELLTIEEDFMIQKFIGRTMYLQSLEKGEFFLKNLE